jgi:hypothetical protein
MVNTFQKEKRKTEMTPIEAEKRTKQTTISRVEGLLSFSRSAMV